MDGFSIEEFLSQFAGVFQGIAEAVMRLFGGGMSSLQDVTDNRPLVTGIAIGFLLAFFLRGVIVKLLIFGFLVAVFFWMFGRPGMG